MILGAFFSSTWLVLGPLLLGQDLVDNIDFVLHSLSNLVRPSSDAHAGFFFRGVGDERMRKKLKCVRKKGDTSSTVETQRLISL